MRLILIKGVAIHLISKDEDFNTYKWATCRKEVSKMKSQLSIIPSDWMFSFHMFWYAHPALVKLWQKLFYVNKVVIDNWDTWFSPWLIAIVCKYKNNFTSVNKQQTTTSCILKPDSFMAKCCSAIHLQFDEQFSNIGTVY